MKTYQQFIKESDEQIYKSVKRRMDKHQRYKSIISKHIDNLTDEDIEFVLDYNLSNGVEMGCALDPGVYKRPDILKHLLDHFHTVQKMSNPITLYRILNVKSKEDINLRNVGKHYQISDVDLCNVLDFCDGWIVKVLADKKDINLDYMIRTNIEFPYEKEVTLKEYPEVDVIGVYHSKDV